MADSRHNRLEPKPPLVQRPLCECDRGRPLCGQQEVFNIMNSTPPEATVPVRIHERVGQASQTLRLYGGIAHVHDSNGGQRGSELRRCPRPRGAETEIPPPTEQTGLAVLCSLGRRISPVPGKPISPCLSCFQQPGSRGARGRLSRSYISGPVPA